MASGLRTLLVMLVSILKMKSKAGKKNDAIQILESIKEPILLKTGCEGVQIYECHGEPNGILYLEYWSNKEAFHRHIQSDLYLKILNVMELSLETPQVHFHEFSGSSGMELIQSLRKTSEEDTNDFGLK